MNTIQDIIVTYLGSYNFDVRWDIPYIVAAALLVLGVWFAFKVVLLIIHGLMGGK